MKHLFLAILLSGLALLSFGQQYATIQGTLKDSTTKEGLISATMIITKVGSAVPSFGSITDFFGHFTLDSIPYGIYDFEFSYVGYESQKLTGITINKDTVIVNISLFEEVAEYDFVNFCDWEIPLISKDNFEKGRIFQAEDIRRMPFKW